MKLPMAPSKLLAKGERLAYRVSVVVGGFGLWAIAWPGYPLWLRITFIFPCLFGVAIWLMQIFAKYLGLGEPLARFKPVVDGLTDGIGIAAILITIGHYYFGLPVSAPEL
jgi:hypothetical protein